MVELLGHRGGLDAQTAQGGHNHDVARAVEIGEDDAGSVTAQRARVGHARAEALQIRGLGRGGHSLDWRAVGGKQPGDIARTNRLDLADDGGVVRRQDLTPAGKAALKTIVMRRVMTRGDDDAGVGSEMADGEAQLGRGTGTIEQPGLPAQGDPSGRNRLGKGARKMPDIMGNDQSGRGDPQRDQVGVKTSGGTEDVELIKTGGADRRVTGSRPGRGIPLLGRRDHPADGTAAHPTRAEGHALVETVLELRPMASLRELANGGDRARRQGAGCKPAGELTKGSRGEAPRGA